MGWEISKTFEFDYGHRVWTQKLEKDFSLDTSCACRHFHGHRGKIIVYLTSNMLNTQGMVTDFKHLNWFKEWINTVLDHKFIMDIKDPLFESEIIWPVKNAENFGLSFQKEGLIKNITHYIVDPRFYEDLPDYQVEKYEGFVFVDFVPTSENLSKWIFGIVSDKMKELNITVSKIEFYETPKSKSVYYEE